MALPAHISLGSWWPLWSPRLQPCCQVVAVWTWTRRASCISVVSSVKRRDGLSDGFAITTSALGMGWHSSCPLITAVPRSLNWFDCDLPAGAKRFLFGPEHRSDQLSSRPFSGLPITTKPTGSHRSFPDGSRLNWPAASVRGPCTTPGVGRGRALVFAGLGPHLHASPSSYPGIHVSSP